MYCQNKEEKWHVFLKYVIFLKIAIKILKKDF